MNRGFGRAFETVTVRKGGNGFGDIDLVYGENPSRNSSNGGFGVESDDYEMYFSDRMFGFGRQKNQKLNANEVGKVIWDDLLRKVGVDYA